MGEGRVWVWEGRGGEGVGEGSVSGGRGEWRMLVLPEVFPCSGKGQAGRREQLAWCGRKSGAVAE